MSAVPFHARLRKMLDAGHAECGWLPEGDKFWVSNPEGLASRVIPLYYEHHSYASFTRSLNAYSFYKMSPSTWAHPLFHRDHPHLAMQITRKATPAKARQRKDKGGEHLRKQLDKEQKALAAAQNEVSRLEQELAAAQKQAKHEKSLLENLERQAVDHVASLAATPLDKYDLDGVKATDFGLSERDLEATSGESETEETEAMDATDDIFADMPSEDALVEMMHRNCKLMKYLCPQTNNKDEELWAQCNCEQTRAALEAYVQCLREKQAQGLGDCPEVREKLAKYEELIRKGKENIARYREERRRQQLLLNSHRDSDEALAGLYVKGSLSGVPGGMHAGGGSAAAVQPAATSLAHLPMPGTEEKCAVM